MKNEINLSKAYAGQNITLSCGLKLNVIYVENRFNHMVITDYEDYYFNYDGTTWIEGEQRYGNVVSIEDTIQVQCARIEGEIEAYENILLTKPAAKTFDFILQKRADAKAKLLTLQNNQ